MAENKMEKLKKELKKGNIPGKTRREEIG